MGSNAFPRDAKCAQARGAGGSLSQIFIKNLRMEAKLDAYPNKKTLNSFGAQGDKRQVRLIINSGT